MLKKLFLSDNSLISVAQRNQHLRLWYCFCSQMYSPYLFLALSSEGAIDRLFMKVISRHIHRSLRLQEEYNFYLLLWLGIGSKSSLNNLLIYKNLYHENPDWLIQVMKLYSRVSRKLQILILLNQPICFLMMSFSTNSNLAYIFQTMPLPIQIIIIQVKIWYANSFWRKIPSLVLKILVYIVNFKFKFKWYKFQISKSIIIRHISTRYNLYNFWGRKTKIRKQNQKSSRGSNDPQPNFLAKTNSPFF